MRESAGVYPRGEIATASAPVRLFFLHFFEQNRTSFQQRDHFFRHVNGFPQVPQTFSGRCDVCIKFLTHSEKEAIKDRKSFDYRFSYAVFDASSSVELCVCGFHVGGGFGLPRA